jgi:hypothetical protein
LFTGCVVPAQAATVTDKDTQTFLCGDVVSYAKVEECRATAVVIRRLAAAECSHLKADAADSNVNMRDIILSTKRKLRQAIAAADVKHQQFKSLLAAKMELKGRLLEFPSLQQQINDLLAHNTRLEAELHMKRLEGIPAVLSTAGVGLTPGGRDAIVGQGAADRDRLYHYSASLRTAIPKTLMLLHALTTALSAAGVEKVSLCFRLAGRGGWMQGNCCHGGRKTPCSSRWVSAFALQVPAGASR